MAKKKLPDGFPTWVSFYDYLNTEKPELLKAKTIQFMQYVPIGITEKYSIQIATVERLCWREIQEYRLTQSETHEVQAMVGHAMSMYPKPNDSNKVFKLLHSISLVFK